jgi:ribosomal protein S18 acetylase RimI-like enzyme
MSALSQTEAQALQEPILRRATPADVEALAAVGVATFSETFGHLYPPQDLAHFLAEAHAPARLQADLADPQMAVWLAEAAGETIGYALAGPCDLPHPHVAPGDGELKRLYLLGGAQRGGLGGRLFTTAMAWLQKDGPRTVWIGVWSENLGAQRLYGRHGFLRCGEYGFRVGQTVDREFILRRSAESFSNAAP